MAQTANGSPLVAGATASNTMEPQMQVIVIRSFLYQGRPVAVGTPLEVPRSLARELVAMGKAQQIEPKATTEVEQDEVPKRRGRPPKTAEEQT